MDYKEIKKEIVEELYKLFSGEHRAYDIEVAIIACLKKREKMEKDQFWAWFMDFFAFSFIDERIRGRVYECYEKSRTTILIKLAVFQELTKLTDISTNATNSMNEEFASIIDDIREKLADTKNEITELKKEIKRMKTEK